MNKAFVEVTGTKVNRDWKFHAYSQSAFIHRMKDYRLVLFTLQDTLSLHSHHCPACTSQTQQLQSILYEILSGWSFVIGGFLGWSFVIGGFLPGESSVGGVAGGRCSLLGGGRSLEATNTWC